MFHFFQLFRQKVNIQYKYNSLNYLTFKGLAVRYEGKVLTRVTTASVSYARVFIIKYGFDFDGQGNIKVKVIHGEIKMSGFVISVLLSKCQSNLFIN